MRFLLDYKIELGDDLVASSALLESLEDHRAELSDVSSLDGELVLKLGDELLDAGYSDPIVRLVAGWARKVPWVIAGDTETVPLRNSELCYAFVPAGDAVEISFFEGDEAEIEEYVVEPTKVMLEDFVNQVIGTGERVLELVKAIDPNLLDSDEDCLDLVASLDVARSAWHDHQVHNRR